MRKLAIKLFVLDYKFGKYPFMRAPTVIFPLLTIFALLQVFVGIDWITYIAAGLFIISVWFGFFHWKIWPVEWHELDGYQKFIYGMAVKSGQLTKPASFYDVDWEEWALLSIKYKNHE